MLQSLFYITVQYSCLAPSWVPTLLGCYEIFYISALGNGWAPAILNTEQEMTFIQEAQKGLNDFRNYWIGGFTYSEPGSKIGYSRYYTISSGNYVSC